MSTVFVGETLAEFNAKKFVPNFIDTTFLQSESGAFENVFEYRSVEICQPDLDIIKQLGALCFDQSGCRMI
jgi:hypothetical protein